MTASQSHHLNYPTVKDCLNYRIKEKRIKAQHKRSPEELVALKSMCTEKP